MPSLVAIRVQDGNPGHAVVHGEGWGDEPVRLGVAGTVLAPLSATTGSTAGDVVRPAGGVFTVDVVLPTMPPATAGGGFIVDARETRAPGRTAQAELASPFAPPHEMRDDSAAWRDDPALRIKDFNERRGRHIEPGLRLTAFLETPPAREAALPAHLAAEDATAGWKPVGPATIWNGQTLVTQQHPKRYQETAPAAGRVTAIAFDPNDQAGNTLYIGAAQGGVWKSTDGGATWTPKSDFEASLAIGALATAEITVGGAKRTRIYAGTGEANFSQDSYYGAGILRSDDGGDTWTLLGQNLFQRVTISRIIVRPRYPDTIIVAAGNGLFFSYDAGATWTGNQSPVDNVAATDVVFRKEGGKEKLLLGLLGGGIFVSTPRGLAPRLGITRVFRPSDRPIGSCSRPLRRNRPPFTPPSAATRPNQARRLPPCSKALMAASTGAT